MLLVTENMVLDIHHDRYGHKYYTYPEHSKMYYDYSIRGSQLFYEPNRTRWIYHCFWPKEALNFVTPMDKRRRIIVSMHSGRLENFISLYLVYFTWIKRKTNIERHRKTLHFRKEKMKLKKLLIEQHFANKVMRRVEITSNDNFDR